MKRNMLEEFVVVTALPVPVSPAWGWERSKLKKTRIGTNLITILAHSQARKRSYTGKGK